MICLSSAGIPAQFETTYIVHNLLFKIIKFGFILKKEENEQF